MKKYRYKKITPKDVKKMKQLRKKGLSYRKIAEKVNICSSSVIYWLKPKEREKTIERAMNSYKKLTKEQRRERERKCYAYKKQYYLERYANDPQFRKRHIKNIQNSFKKRQKRWERENKCSSCGREKIEKKWRMCESCREKKRKKKEGERKQRKSL